MKLSTIRHVSKWQALNRNYLSNSSDSDSSILKNLDLSKALVGVFALEGLVSSLFRFLANNHIHNTLPSTKKRWQKAK